GRRPAATAAGDDARAAGGHAGDLGPRRVLCAHRAAHRAAGERDARRGAADLPAPAQRDLADAGRHAAGRHRRLARAWPARGMRTRVLAGLALVAFAAQTAVAQVPKKDDPIQAEQRKLREAEQQLKEERRKAAEAREKETSILAELDRVEQRLADKQRDIARLDGRIKKAQADVTSLRGEV